MVRQILNITGRPGTATYIESEARMSGLTGAQNQIVRALLDDYSDISFDTTKAFGKGTDYNPQRDKAAIAEELRRMLYPSAANELNEDGTVTIITYSSPGTISFVPAEYLVGSQDEFD